MSLLVEIKYNESLIKYDDLKKEVRDLIEERIELNARLKDRLEPNKELLQQQKPITLKNIKDKTKLRNDAEKSVKNSRETLNNCKTIETKSISENTDDSRHAVSNYIESVILKS